MLISHFSSQSNGARSAGRSDTVALSERDRVILDNEDLIAKLRARIAELEAQLANRPAPEPDPYVGDTVENIERLIAEAYAANNVDWLIEVIDRLLRMGPKGYPLLRKLMMDIAFRAKFLPTRSEFRIDQIYSVGKVFQRREKQFIGFLNFLLVEKDTHPWFKQGAMVAASYFVGSRAKGSEELQQTLMQLFIGEGAVGIPGGFNMGNMGQRMQVFAKAMSGDAEMIGPLRDELNKTKDKKMQADILGALAYLGDPEALPLIKDRLDPAQGDYRKELEALGRLGTEEAHATASDFVRSIPDSKRFYRHASRYVRAGGGDMAIKLIRERVTSNPNDPEIKSAVGTLRRFPTKESQETLQYIADSTPDEGLAKNAQSAADDVARRLRGEIPGIPK